MIPDFTGDFLSFNSTEDGDIIEVLAEGKIEFNDVLKKDMYNIQVKRGDKVMIWSPTNKQGKTMQDAFGKDDKDWVGKRVTIMHIEGKMVVRSMKI